MKTEHDLHANQLIDVMIFLGERLDFFTGPTLWPAGFTVSDTFPLNGFDDEAGYVWIFAGNAYDRQISLEQ
jgi:hypothetical protein